jgi:hypothetical protein
MGYEPLFSRAKKIARRTHRLFIANDHDSAVSTGSRQRRISAKYVAARAKTRAIGHIRDMQIGNL